MFLATTGLTEFWDTSDQLLLLGPWCLRHDRKQVWRDLPYTIAPSPWTDHGSVEDAARYCAGVIDALVADLRIYLNQVHSVDFSERYWRILLAQWLHYYTHPFYDRYSSLKRARDVYGDLCTTALQPSTFVTPTDLLDLHQLLHTDIFNLQLYSQVLEALAVPGVTWREMPPGLARAPMGVGRPSLRARFRRQLVDRTWVAAAHVLRPAVLVGEIELSTYDRLRLLLAMNRHGWAIPRPAAIRFERKPVVAELRAGLRKLPPRDEFYAVLLRSLEHNLPALYLEGYAEFRRACVDAWPSPPRVFFSSVDWYKNEFFKFLAAEYAERGSRLVGMQHGGMYGMSKVVPHEVLEQSIVDRWLTYGWSTDQARARVDAVPHPRFAPVRQHRAAYRKGSSRLALVAISGPRYLEHFASWPGGGGRFDLVLEWRTRFVRTLQSAARAALVVRLSPKAHHFTWGEAERMVDACGPVQFDSRGTLREFARGTQLIVLEYFSTPFLELLAANVPTVMFWDPTWWQMRDDVAPLFEELRRVGILWDSPETCAEQVSRVFEDPMAWWKTNAVQEARRVFVECHAVFGRDWLGRWIQALEEEVAAAQPRRSRRSEPVPAGRPTSPNHETSSRNTSRNAGLTFEE